MFKLFAGAGQSKVFRCRCGNEFADVDNPVGESVWELGLLIIVMRNAIAAPETNAKKILIFLPTPAAETIVGHLSQRRYSAVAVSAVPEVFAFALTTRPNINPLRNIRAIPIINRIYSFMRILPPRGAHSAAKTFMVTGRVSVLSGSVSVKQSRRFPPKPGLYGKRRDIRTVGRSKRIFSTTIL